MKGIKKQFLASSSLSHWTGSPTKNGKNTWSNFSNLVASQIRFLVSNLSKKNYKNNLDEIEQLIETFGPDAYLFLLRTLISSIDFRDQKGPKDQSRIMLLSYEIVELSKTSNFTSVICQTLEGIEMPLQEDFFLQFSKTLKLSLSQELLLGLALAQSNDQNVKQEGTKYLKSKLADLPQNVLKSLPENFVHSLITFLRNNEGFTKQLLTITKSLQKSNSSIAMAPLLNGASPVDSRESYLEDKKENVLEKLSNPSISEIMEDLGYGCCENFSNFKNLCSEFNPLVESDVAKILGMMARTHANLEGSLPLSNSFPPSSSSEENNELKTWDLGVFVDVIKSLCPTLNWPAVIKHLDHPHFQIHDIKGLTLIVTVYKKATQEPFPIEYLLGNWENTKGQLSLLKFALISSDLINFSASPLRVDSEGLLPNKSASSQNWHSLSLINTLIRLSEVESYAEVRQIFTNPLKQYPDLLILGLAQSKPEFSTLCLELSSLILTNILTSTSNNNNTLVIQKLWQLNPGMLAKGMVDSHSKDPSCLSRLLEIATQDLKALTGILETRPFSFSIDLASLASRREFLNLEKWLTEKILEHGESFSQACVNYVKEKISKSPKEISSQQKLLETLTIFFNCLSSSNLSAKLQEELKQLAPRFPKKTEDTTNFSPLENPPAVSTPTSPTISPSSPQLPIEQRAFPKEVEDAANAYFQKIYTGQLTIDQIISLLKQFKSSKDQRDQDIFGCMIHNLFDEYRFFPKYPDKELTITGILFGSLIQHQLVSYLPLGLALRYVLDALRKPPGSKMFQFGVTALDHFKSRLSEWPQYCSHILQIPHIQKEHPEIIQFIEKTHPNDPSATENIKPMSIKPTFPLKPKQETDIQDAHSISIETLLKEKKNFPSVEVVTQDKIHFILNNVSMQNLEQKATELKDLLKTEEHLKYLAHYLVVKRVSIETNFHQLYVAFLEKINSPKLWTFLLLAAYEAIKLLINSEKITGSIQERNLLKNLGSWLGQTTLAKNKPLLQKDLGLKELLYQGYEEGKLLAMVPFVCKVLETCSNSKVFKPPNPWLMALMRLLAEIYRKPNLRLNLKFEIEVLCRGLGLDVNEIKPSDTLKDKKQYVGPNNFDFNPPPEPEPQPEQPPAPPTPTAIKEEPSQDPLVSHLNISPSIALFTQQPQLKKCVSIAIDRAIREIISPVVERSVTIACVTTKELVFKDFATEPDEIKMKKAAHLMVQNLAGSLALVTCKDPLRVSMSTHLKTLLQDQTPEQYHPLIEQAITTIALDNLDLACTLIEKAATEKAVRDTEQAFSGAYALRKKYKENRNPTPFYDSTHFGNPRYLGLIPEPLRPKLGGLTPSQFAVFEDFARIPHIQPNSGYAGNSEGNQGIDQINAEGQELLTVEQAAEKFDIILSELNTIVKNLTSPPFSDPEIVVRMKKIPALIVQSSQRPQIAIIFAQKAFKALYESETKMQHELNVAILDRIVDAFKKLSLEITTWITKIEFERKNHLKIVEILLKHQLLDVPELDSFLSRCIEAHNKTALQFSIYLIKQCVVIGKFLIPTDFKKTLETLSKTLREGSIPSSQEEIKKLLEEMQAVNKMQVLGRRSESDSGIRDKVAQLFDEWMMIYNQPNQSDKAYAKFISERIKPILKEDQWANSFFRMCTEMSVDYYFSVIQQNGASAYQSIDGFSKMVVQLVKHTEFENDIRVSFLSNILSLVFHVLSRDYNTIRKNKFNQLPYFRFFSGCLVDLNRPDPNLEPIQMKILIIFCSLFERLQPQQFPGFCFAWLELISHRTFMPRLLSSKTHQTLFQKLLIALLKFLEPFLRKAELGDIRLLYKGTLRVLLILLHDFPEFLCDFHFSFCDVIPPSCIQMRNLILSAFPHSMRLPDPFTPNLKVDLLQEIHQSPTILSNYIQSLGPFRQEIDTYLKTRTVNFLMELKSKLLLPPQEAMICGTKYNVPLINSLVLYVGIMAIQTKPPQTASLISTHSPSIEIFQYLASNLDSEGRYLFLNAIANQLRYPNNQTHYFSCVLLFLFVEATQEIIQEQITRVLLERLIVSRPHPWGLLITFIELIKNPRYNFWNHGFTKCAPEIERVFESVARSCAAPAKEKEDKSSYPINK